MDFTLENAVSIYYASLEHQLAYWNLYLVVAFALLAYLGANRTQASLIKLCIVIFVVFSVSNLIVVSKLQAHLVTVSNGITTYVEASSKIPVQFRQSLLEIESLPVGVIVIYHIISTFALSVAMFFAGKINIFSDDRNN